MLGRIVGLLLGLGLMGLAYAILNPGGLEGRIPPIGLGAFEAVRTGLALAAGLLGLTMSAAALAGAVRKTDEPPERERPVFRFEEEPAQAETSWRDIPAEDSPFDLGLQPVAPTTEPEPAAFPLEPDVRGAPEPFAPLAPLPAMAASPAPEPEPTPEPLAEIVPAAESAVEEPPALIEPVASEPAPEPAATSPAEPSGLTFAQARAALHDHARAENWAEAAQALKQVSALAATPHEQMLAAQDAGDFARAQGRNDEAFEAYEEALFYARQAGSPDELSDALINSGDMAYEEHRLDAAVAAYEEAVALRRGAVTGGAGSEPVRRLALALERLADAREDRGHRMRALDIYRESTALMAGLAAADAERFGADHAASQQRLAELEARVMA